VSAPKARDGLRLSVSLVRAEPGEAAPPEGTFVYRGTVTIGAESREIVARATAADVALEWRTAPTDRVEIEKVVRALLRAATRAELARGAPPPRRITRWREV
jgi:hypothetical protein